MGELLIVLVIVVVLFGASRLPQLGEGVGKAIRGLKRGLRDEEPQPSEPVERVSALAADSATPQASDLDLAGLDVASPAPQEQPVQRARREPR